MSTNAGTPPGETTRHRRERRLQREASKRRARRVVLTAVLRRRDIDRALADGGLSDAQRGALLEERAKAGERIAAATRAGALPSALRLYRQRKEQAASGR